jgi:predicted nuclease of predicted toxin-antitoxin system
VKFLVDMPLSPELAQWLRTEGHDAVHANELSMNRSPDSEILQAAARGDRVVITADLDFPRLLAELGLTGPGLILLRGGNYSEAPGLCARVVMSNAHAELPRSIGSTVRESGDVGFLCELKRVGHKAPVFLTLQ